MSNLDALMTAAENRDGAGAMRNLAMRVLDMDNPQMTADVVREVFKNADGSTGNKLAQAGAKGLARHHRADAPALQCRWRRIGKLGYGYLSQAHDAVLVAKAGADAWAAKVLPMLDREQYVRADGSLMNDAEVMDLLRGAHETLASGGANRPSPASSRARARGQPRQRPPGAALQGRRRLDGVHARVRRGARSMTR